MSYFNSVVPVPLGEIRRLDGKLPSGADVYPGTLVTATGKFDVTVMNHVMPEYPNATFALNSAGNTKGVMIVMDQIDLVTKSVTDALPAGSHARGHVLKQGEEVTVIVATPETDAAIASGDGLKPAANGLVAKCASGDTPMFSAIEAMAKDATGDSRRILARVL